MEIHLDGKKREVKEGTTLDSLLPGRELGCAVAIVRAVEAEEEQTPFIRLNTSKGEVVIETTDPRFGLIQSSGAIRDLRVQWEDRYAVAFGPFATEFSPSRTPASYDRGDVILGCGGYDPKRSLLIFSRMRHLADHGASAEGGVLGKVVSGRGVVDTWESGDQISSMERVISWEDRTRSFTTTEGTLPLQDGMQIITYVGGTAQGFTPDHVDTIGAESVDHLLLVLKDQHFTVHRATSTYIQDCRISPLDVPPAVKLPRREGTISVRTVGPSRGCVYIYRTDVASHPTHTVVGQVVHGLELVKLAKDGETLCIRMSPERLDLVGMTVSEGLQVAEERGVRAQVDARDGNHIIVDQEPSTTLEVLAEKQIRLISAPAEKVVTVRLDDAHAPVTAATFREMTGLRFRAIGKLPVFFTFEDVVLFKTASQGTAKIMPENTPASEVPAYQIGVTNEARKGSGTIGVRLSDNSEFGPTGEPFEATNIVGIFLEPEKLRGLKEKGTLYIRETSL
ncbi:MAG: methanogenesis marker 3 protein [Methanomicrobiales archaeon]|nr:methanogenesis marker 3 protein [Methanomicrobiales archaeon]